MTSARRRVAFFVAGFFFADDFFFGNDFIFAARFFGAAFLAVFFLAEGAFLAADFFRNGFFFPMLFFLRAGFFLAMGEVYQNSPQHYTYAACFHRSSFILRSKDPLADVQRQCVSAFIYRFLCLLDPSRNCRSNLRPYSVLSKEKVLASIHYDWYGCNFLGFR